MTSQALCEHEPDWHSTAGVGSTPSAPGGVGFAPGEHGQATIICKKCGFRGQIILHLDNIDW